MSSHDNPGLGPGQSEGRGTSFGEAVGNAWDNAKGPDRPAEMKVIAIFVKGTNPISGYRVVLGPA